MQGTQIHHPELFMYTDMDSLIDSNHMLRKIEQLIDFTFVRKLTVNLYSNRHGRPSIDPELYFRMQLIGYLYNIFSERKLCEAVHYNLAYRWFCKLSLADKVPSHSSLSKIRSRIGEEIFAKFFHYVVELCKDAGLVDGKEVMTDGSLILANASLDSMEAIDDKIKEEERGALSDKTLNPPSRKLSNKTHISRTDPDATLAKKNGSPRALKYKVHDTIDAKSRVILDSKITTGARHESNEYIPQLMEIEARLKINIGTAIADRGYGAAENIDSLHKHGIRTNIPLFSTRSGMAHISADAGFIYDKESDIFHCPQGFPLTPYPTINNNSVLYRSNGENCRTCPVALSCEARKKNNSWARLVSRNRYQPLYDKVNKQMKEPGFITKMCERMWKMEGIFAEAKAHHGLNRAKHRTITKVQIQAYMTAIVQNIKRLVKSICALLQLKIIQNYFVNFITSISKTDFFNTPDRL